MLEVVKSLIAGLICGALFAGVGLPVPAPPTLAGVSGIVGLFLGYIIIKG